MVSKPENNDPYSVLPQDDQPWQTGAIATYDSSNLGQVLRASAYEPEMKTNPDDYIEAQIHGELRIHRDVKYVRADFVQLFGHPQFKKLYEAFQQKELEIKWYNKNHGIVMIEDPTSPEETKKSILKIWKKAEKACKSFYTAEKELNKNSENHKRKLNFMNKRKEMFKILNSCWVELCKDEYFVEEKI